MSDICQACHNIRDENKRLYQALTDISETISDHFEERLALLEHENAKLKSDNNRLIEILANVTSKRVK